MGGGAFTNYCIILYHISPKLIISSVNLKNLGGGNAPLESPRYATDCDLVTPVNACPQWGTSLIASWTIKVRNEMKLYIYYNTTQILMVDPCNCKSPQCFFLSSNLFIYHYHRRRRQPQMRNKSLPTPNYSSIKLCWLKFQM